jgi:hypothetical protein
LGGTERNRIWGISYSVSIHGLRRPKAGAASCQRFNPPPEVFGGFLWRFTIRFVA